MNAHFRITLLAVGCFGLALAAGTGLAVALGTRPDAQPNAAPDAAAAPHTYSAAALYNKGNAAARAGKAALAVLSYERARLLAPGDGDIRANLQTVRKQAGLPTQGAGWLAEHARIASPDTLYWCGFAGVLLAGGGLIARRLRPARLSAATLVAAAGAVMIALTVGEVLETRSLLHTAVAMIPTAVRASPVSTGDPIFTLPAADLVQVQDEHRDYLLVCDGDGRQGWVARDDLTWVVPPDPVSSLKQS